MSQDQVILHSPASLPQSSTAVSADHSHRRKETIAARIFVFLIGTAIALSSFSAMAQSAREIRGAAAVVPVTDEPAPKIVVDAPLSGSLAQGRVVIQYRAENLRIVPVYGTAALSVSPRIGHIHVTVDSAPWHWADASGEPLIINGLPPGPHQVLIELANANHRILDRGVARFVVPDLAASDSRR